MADNLKVTLDLRNVSEDADAAAELVGLGQRLLGAKTFGKD
jgi:hypothetical protein